MLSKAMRAQARPREWLGRKDSNLRMPESKSDKAKSPEQTRTLNNSVFNGLSVPDFSQFLRFFAAQCPASVPNRGAWGHSERVPSRVSASRFDLHRGSFGPGYFLIEDFPKITRMSHKVIGPCAEAPVVVYCRAPPPRRRRFD